MAFRLFDAKALPQPMMDLLLIGPSGTYLGKVCIKIHFSTRIYITKSRYFCSGLNELTLKTLKLCHLLGMSIFLRSCNYNDVIMSAMASQITGVSSVCPTVCSGANQRKHQRSAPLTFVRGIHRWPMDSPQKGPVTRKMFPFDDVIMHMVVLDMITQAVIIRPIELWSIKRIA